MTPDTHRGRSSHDSPFTTIDGQRYYVVDDIDRMPPFLMSIVSDGDRWMFLSSSGALTAGRRDAEDALFPYETDDRIHRAAGLNGPATAVRPVDGTLDDVWRPLWGRPSDHRRRRVGKSVDGESAIFDEHDDATGLSFRYLWQTSDRFGFVRTSTITNNGDRACELEVVDGLRNLLPHGLDPTTYRRLGNLSNAYKRSELIDADLRFATYSLESHVSDQTEPSVALRATVAWSVGLDGARVSLDPEVASDLGLHPIDAAGLRTGVPGAYFLCDTLRLEPGESRTWSIVADVALDQPAVTELIADLHSRADLGADLHESADRTSATIREIMARADALQCTGDEVATAHHLSNVVYNVMRGGVPLEGYDVEVADFIRHLERRNLVVAAAHRELLDSLGPSIDRSELLAVADATDDPDLQRLAREYLPFSFSRRHGDPSRPWNAFSIRITDEMGRPARYYEGNWRDIFQNWEATAGSFPHYLPDLVSVFVSASTTDGFNPYRITSDGIDWEVPDPEDPWSNIGYWGDHQIVYLHRLLEDADAYLPGSIRRMLGEERFSYADVPYRLVPYERIVDDPKSTIDYDDAAATRSAERVERFGADGRLVWRDGSVYHVTLAEKLVVPALAKLSNFVPTGGIWMNTQRPEWNDANNALVGYGLSMVTLYQLRSYLAYLRHLIDDSAESVEVSTEVAEWLRSVTGILGAASIEEAAIDALARKSLLDALARTFDEYRARVYEGFSGRVTVDLIEIVALCDAAMGHLDRSIVGARRDDGLFDSYNLIAISVDGARADVERLGPMLEGQVAVLESGVLDANESADVVDALYASAMYRPDQDSFMLYPARSLPPFLERNVVPEDAIDGNPLLVELLERRDPSVVVRDRNGVVRFAADLATREDLENQLAALTADATLTELISTNGPATVDAYRTVFGHHAYTGRSGSMYGYEGIGSIYWHMVAKLLVALQESALRFEAAGAPPDAVDRMVNSYWRVRAGLGFNKRPPEHGAVPIDPYSHTPDHAGAQQPGMTGLVKEEILIRPAELGVVVRDGDMRFERTFVGEGEPTRVEIEWSVLTAAMEWRHLRVPAGAQGLTVCQVPVVVTLTDGAPSIEVDLASGETLEIPGASLGRELSAEVFGRTGDITCIRVQLGSTPG